MLYQAHLVYFLTCVARLTSPFLNPSNPHTFTSKDMAVITKTTTLPSVHKKFDRTVNNDRVLGFRKTYRSFRTGQAAGAKGEINQFLVDSGAESFPLDEMALESETFSTIERGGNENIYNAVTNYRLSYASFRQGNSQGAKGEVTAVSQAMTLEHAKSMPVAQKAHLMQRSKDVDYPDTKLHVHFGGGKLGLGLLSPALSNAYKLGIPFVLVDGPFGDYAKLIQENQEYVNFFVNGQLTLSNVKLVTRVDQLPKNMYDPTTKLFVCSTDTNLVSKVIDMASTVSTSLGPIMPKVVSPYFNKPSNKYLYCCENDHGMVEKLEENLKGFVNVITCMVDRISTERTVDGNNIYAVSEPFEGEIVILHPPKGAVLPAFKGSNVNVPKSKATADYFCRRKIGIVNGMHTTLAFISLLHHCKGDVAEDVDLISPKKSSPEQQAMIHDFMVARLLLILYEHDTDVIKDAHDIKTDEEVARVLLDYGEATLLRYDTIEDRTSRVLGGGVANRWSTRLSNVKRYFDTQSHLGGVSSILIKMAGVKEAEMRANIEKLVKESEKFVGQKPAWETSK
mmetsp:Transcript_14874/g.22144  ORF Transcript_14874/g.22144 Transcript_14874/m.22144 type:complete len:565 (+) Transcript_14874:232-1926(+)